MEQKHNVVGWFEIPVENMDRAIHFYEAVFELDLQAEEVGPLDMAWFPWVEGGLGSPGSLVHYPEAYTPSDKGVLVYFTAHSGNLQNELSRVEIAGGEIIQEKTLITEEIGYKALIKDSEGNIIALHSHE